MPQEDEDQLRIFTENLITCGMCLGEMVRPKLLRCGHAFCLKCLLKYIEPTEEQKIFLRAGVIIPKKHVECILRCVHQTQIPEDGLQNLPDYFLLQQAKEYLERDDEATTARVSLPWCILNDHNKQYNMWCSTCNELICHQCRVQSHSKHPTRAVTAKEAFVKCLKANSDYNRIDNVRQLQVNSEIIHNHYHNISTTLNSYEVEIISLKILLGVVIVLLVFCGYHLYALPTGYGGCCHDGEVKAGNKFKCTKERDCIMCTSDGICFKEETAITQMAERLTKERKRINNAARARGS